MKKSNLTYKPGQRLGNILLHGGVVDASQLDFCLNIQKNGGERLGSVLKHYGFVDENHMTSALAQQAGWELYSGNYELDGEMAAVLGMPFLLECMVFPARVGDQTVFVMTRTDDMATTDIIQSRLQAKARFFLAPESELRQALRTLTEATAEKSLRRVSMEESLTVWFDECLDLAIAKGATDMHIEPSSKAVEMRLRIDGALQFMDSMRFEFLPRLANIIFHRADVTISDFSHFHDAHFTHRYLNRHVDIRVSHIPSVWGSSLVLRLLDKNKAAVPLTSLGYGNAQWELIRDNLVKPAGITLIAGPTGCGKTTTLYAMLNHLKSISRKIVTIEDPVEMPLSLMTQVEVNEKKGIGFGNAARAFLRHDPDIILIGEIRDRETAQEAMRAAMTGHKVFATLHANTSVDAILRLNDLGVPYVHMAGNLNMVVSQRLLRRLCASCRIAQPVCAAGLLSYEHKYIEDQGQQVFIPGSCSQCAGGFKGRVVAAEILSLDARMEHLIGQGDVPGLRSYLNGRQGHVTMIDDARRLVREGAVDLKEAVRVLG